MPSRAGFQYFVANSLNLDTIDEQDVYQVVIDGVEAVYPSASNFLLVRFVDAARVFTALRDRGIILRDQSRQPTLENCIRITVGTKDENERLLTELEEILKEAA